MTVLVFAATAAAVMLCSTWRMLMDLESRIERCHESVRTDLPASV